MSPVKRVSCKRGQDKRMNQIFPMFLSITLFLLQFFSNHWSFILTKYSLERNRKDRCYFLSLWPTFYYFQRSLVFFFFFRGEYCIFFLILTWTLLAEMMLICSSVPYLHSVSTDRISIYTERVWLPLARAKQTVDPVPQKAFSPPLPEFSIFYNFIHFSPNLLLLSSGR